ncbi:hypothetical protein [Streptomyces niveus]|uniref:hypothetical protein n=1 Tax=Streptomyces niveus TaxID=193462 RepID=UPI003449294A
MSVLLIGNWDGPLLTITASYTVATGDQEAIDDLLHGHDGWAYEFLVDRHAEAVQRAYDQEIAPGTGACLVDDVEGFEPTR